MRGALVLCSIVGLVFSVWAICWPEVWISSAGIAGGDYREMWMTVGMLNGMLSIGLLLASNNPIRHWPNVLVVALAKTGAFIGFSWAVWRGVFPIQAGWAILINDVIWIPILIKVLGAVAQTYLGQAPFREQPYSIAEALEVYETNRGQSLKQLASQERVVVVFLRHFGCTFTRQLLRELDQLSQECETHRAQLVLVHMLQNGQEREYLSAESVMRVSDPYCELYRAFGLGKGGFLELFGPRVLLHGLLALVKGCGVGHLAGDGLQMPGVFLLDDGHVVSQQKARSIAELPDMQKLFGR